ncbi:hypothetical protein [Rhodococcus sp. NBC_00294]|uniref:hypothetical protein n=1 Tax=Rhodococcus sp. NBC_00294 TaxID=2976004 RepID=UPI002E2C08A0|nr:hypothetical protein [Rhodococcus sp. NBC_00294]
MLTPFAIAGAGLLILAVRHVAVHGRGRWATAAGWSVILGSIAASVTIAVATIAFLATFFAAFGLVLMVLAFMIPLAYLGGSVGNGSRGVYPRRYY